MRTWGDGTDGVSVPPPGAFLSVAAGHKFLMSLHLFGHVVITSNNFQIPSGTLTTGEFVQVSASYEHGLALRGSDDDPALSPRSPDGGSTLMGRRVLGLQMWVTLPIRTQFSLPQRT